MKCDICKEPVYGGHARHVECIENQGHTAPVVNEGAEYPPRTPQPPIEDTPPDFDETATQLKASNADLLVACKELLNAASGTATRVAAAQTQACDAIARAEGGGK